MSEYIGGDTNRNEHVPGESPQPDAAASHEAGPDAENNATEPIAPLTAPGHDGGSNPTMPLHRPQADATRQWQAPESAAAGQPATDSTPEPAGPYGYGSRSYPQAPSTTPAAGSAAYGRHAPQDGQQGQQGYGQHGQQGYGQHGQQGYGQADSASEHQANPGTHAGAGYPASNAYPHTLSPAVKAPSKPRRKVGMGLFAASVIAAALIGGGAAAGTSFLVDGQNSGVVASSNQPAAPLVVNNTNSVNAVSAAAAKAMPSVVTISATSGSSGGTGSGIVLDTAGHILTNTHVVTLDGAAAHATIQVQTSDGKVYAGKVVGTDPLSDLAVVKIDAPNLVPATLGDSNKINVGDTVIAIGSPLGLNGTVTDGIISTLNRTIQVASSAVPSTPSDGSQDQNGGGNGGFQFSPPGGGQNSNPATGTVNLNVIQTDAAINPGNSGGALVSTSGQIIGVNVAIASTGSSSSSTSQSGNIGVGFSIPIDNAKRIANEIIANGKATHGQLGVSVSGTSALGQNSQFSAGATVAQVTSGSAAAKAGLQKGDVITKFGDRTISDASSLTAAVREQAGGATVKVTFTRSGKTMQKDVTLDTMPAS
ncbi:trypsin-like peptidase domain-containing protein [Arthrobacter sp.]|uniref:trypsin-like peptidase domain-containing protein n=1 Tax=Arthrobacter sp. TaxID=1667 RepID=UPI002590930F|nr:trypsin-like peptidase domain-containing protein [Arthrobacter sp.]